jgi:hypothetical protein
MTTRDHGQAMVWPGLTPIAPWEMVFVSQINALIFRYRPAMLLGTGAKTFRFP